MHVHPCALAGGDALQRLAGDEDDLGDVNGVAREVVQTAVIRPARPAVRGRGAAVRGIVLFDLADVVADVPDGLVVEPEDDADEAHIGPKRVDKVACAESREELLVHLLGNVDGRFLPLRKGEHDVPVEGGPVLGEDVEFCPEVFPVVGNLFSEELRPGHCAC